MDTNPAQVQQDPIQKAQQKRELRSFREGTSVHRVERPSRLERARRLGYKAKQGFLVARVKVVKGKRKRPKPPGGRKPKKFGAYFTLHKSKQQVAEERAARKFPNCEVLNSYWAGEDGQHYWFEVILVDRAHPAILTDKQVGAIALQRGRVFRGRTAAGQKSRGLQR